MMQAELGLNIIWPYLFLVAPTKFGKVAVQGDTQAGYDPSVIHYTICSWAKGHMIYLYMTLCHVQIK